MIAHLIPKRIRKTAMKAIAERELCECRRGPQKRISHVKIYTSDQIRKGKDAEHKDALITMCDTCYEEHLELERLHHASPEGLTERLARQERLRRRAKSNGE